jgi:hypothetical protein
MATVQDTLDAIKIGLIKYFSVENHLVQPVPHTNPVCQERGDIVIFSYVIDDIFEEVKKITAIRAKGMKDGQGKPMLDQYTMTSDERSLFDTFSKDGTTDMYSIFTPYSRRITGYFYDQGELIPQYRATISYVVDNLVYYQGSIYKCILPSLNILPTVTTNWEPQPLYVDTKGKVIFIIDYHPEYKNTVIQLIESRLRTGFVSFILAQWYRMIGLNDLYNSYLSDYSIVKDAVKGNLLNLKVTKRRFIEL